MNNLNQIFLIFSIHFQQVNVLIYLRYFFSLRLVSLVSNSVLVTKFACFNLASKTPAAKLLNSGVVIYSSWLWSVSVFSISLIVVLRSVFCFLTKLLTLRILFSTAINAEFAAKPLILDILFSISVFYFLFSVLNRCTNI